MRRQAIVVLVIVLFSTGYARAGWLTIDKPGAGYTCVYGIDGSNLVGHYDDGTLNGFLYNLTSESWTTIDSSWNQGTWVMGIDGSNLAGYFRISEPLVGFLYNGTDWTTISAPGSEDTRVNGISGSNLVGTYQVAAQYGPPNPDITHGFLYNMTTQSWTFIDMPGAHDTLINGIDGSNLVGVYYDARDVGHGFLYDGADCWTTLDMPGAYQTCIRGISGGNFVGFYDSSDFGRHSFLYNTTTQIWTTIDKPGVAETDVWGIDGSNLVGQYYDNGSHGFIYTIPEPATLLLLGLGAVMSRKRYCPFLKRGGK